MNKLFAIALLFVGCARVEFQRYEEPDSGESMDAGSSWCKVDTDCPDGETCNWKSIAEYNPNVPGGFAGECTER